MQDNIGNAFKRSHRPGSKASRHKTNDASFTLVDLLVIIAIITIFPAILLPALNIATRRTQGGWKMYAGNNGFLAMNNVGKGLIDASANAASTTDVTIAQLSDTH